MLGTYDFCGHYEWTFAWLEREGGAAALRAYWEEAIAGDSQRHAREAIENRGIEGMRAYWGATLDEEGGEEVLRHTDQVFRMDFHACPSKGFLIRNDLEQFPDYCDHCLGWIGPMLKRAGYVVYHEHNHRGQCWWEIRRKDDAGGATPPSAWPDGPNGADVRCTEAWQPELQKIDRFVAATEVDQKMPPDQKR